MLNLPSADYDIIRENIRKIIIESLNVNQNNIRNAASMYGSNLTKLISVFESMSYNRDETFMVYELLESKIDNTYIIKESDGSSTSVQDYDYNIKIYGEKSHNMVQKIMCLFKEPDIILLLRKFGVRVIGIPQPDTTHELINNVFWTRCDITIKLQILYNFKFKESEIIPEQEINFKIKIK